MATIKTRLNYIDLPSLLCRGVDNMRSLTILLLTLFLSGTALAHQCPSLIHKIDAQLENTELDSSTLSEVRQLRDEGAELHRQGKHSESVEVLNEALGKLKAAGSSSY